MTKIQGSSQFSGAQYQCCGSGMFIPDPDFYPSRIPDLGSGIQKQEQKWGVKKICCHTFFCSHKFHKIVNYFIFEMPKKKIWANFQRIIELFTQKIVLNLSKKWVWDPGSGKKPITDPGSATLPNTVKPLFNSVYDCLSAGLKVYCSCVCLCDDNLIKPNLHNF